MDMRKWSAANAHGESFENGDHWFLSIVSLDMYLIKKKEKFLVQVEPR
jgi:hypothetical protein